VQLAATEKPFLVYADRAYFKFQAEAAELLARRAIYTETEADFFDSLARFMAQPDWTPVRPVNDEFLAAYATGGTDGRAAERMAAFLHGVALGIEEGVTDVAHQR
jgi:hypothetical protein